MKTRHAVLAVALAGAILAACSKSSTGPSDPVVGTWQVTWQGQLSSTALTPTPWTITVSKSGTTYTGKYADLTWSYTSPVSWIDTFSDTATASTFTIRNDSILLHAQDPIAPACALDMVGAITGSTVTLGTVAAGGTMCRPGSWTWSATKQ